MATTLTFNGQNSNRANAAFMIGLFTILGALAFQYIGGYVPCELCYAQRTPYYIGLPVLAAVIGGWGLIPVPLRIGATLAIAGIFAWSAWLGGYHAGVEWGFWPGPNSCSGTGAGVSFDSLNDLNAARIVPCDQVQWRFLGLSFAGYNALISLLITGLLLWSAEGQFRRFRRTRA